MAEFHKSASSDKDGEENEEDEAEKTAKNASQETVSEQIVDYYNTYAQNKQLNKYLRGTATSTLQIIQTTDAPSVSFDTTTNNELGGDNDAYSTGQMTNARAASPTSSVTSTKKLEWDNGADIGYDNCNNNNSASLQKSASLPSLTLQQTQRFRKTIVSSISGDNIDSLLHENAAKPCATSTPSLDVHQKRQKFVQLTLTTPITIECVTSQQKATKHVQTGDSLLKHRSPRPINDCSSSSNGSKCESFEYVVPGGVDHQASSSGGTRTTPSVRDVPHQASDLRLRRQLAVLRRLLKTRRYDEVASKTRHVTRTVDRILQETVRQNGNKYTESSTNGTNCSTNGTNGTIGTNSSDGLLFQPRKTQPAPILTTKIFTDEFRGDSGTVMVTEKNGGNVTKRGIFSVVQTCNKDNAGDDAGELHETPTDGAGDGGGDGDGSYKSWRSSKTDSERRLEEVDVEKGGKGDQILKYASAQRQHQLTWINNEISHLSKLRDLLKKPPVADARASSVKQHTSNNKQMPKHQTTTTVYMVGERCNRSPICHRSPSRQNRQQPQQPCTSSSSSAQTQRHQPHNYVICTDLSGGGASSSTSNSECLLTYTDRRNGLSSERLHYQVRCDDDDNNNNRGGTGGGTGGIGVGADCNVREIDVSAHENYTNIRVKGSGARCGGGMQSGTFPRSVREPERYCQPCGRMSHGNKGYYCTDTYEFKIPEKSAQKSNLISERVAAIIAKYSKNNFPASQKLSPPCSAPRPSPPEAPSIKLIQCPYLSKNTAAVQHCTAKKPSMSVDHNVIVDLEPCRCDQGTNMAARSTTKRTTQNEVINIEILPPCLTEKNRVNMVDIPPPPSKQYGCGDRGTQIDTVTVDIKEGTDCTCVKSTSIQADVVVANKSASTATSKMLTAEHRTLIDEAPCLRDKGTQFERVATVEACAAAGCACECRGVQVDEPLETLLPNRNGAGVVCGGSSVCSTTSATCSSYCSKKAPSRGSSSVPVGGLKRIGVYHVCSCCKRANVSQRAFASLRQKLSSATVAAPPPPPLCRACYRQHVRQPMPYEMYTNANHRCRCFGGYTMVETRTLNELKKTLCELDENERTKGNCKCCVRDQNKDGGGVAYVLTFDEKHQHKRCGHSVRSLDSDASGADHHQPVYTIQEYLSQNRPDFIKQAEERRKLVVNLNLGRRESGENHRLELLKNTQNKPNIRNPPKSIRKSTLYSMLDTLQDLNLDKRIFTAKEMKEINNRNYRKLPEVQQKLKESRDKQIKLANRLVASNFNKV